MLNSSTTEISLSHDHYLFPNLQITKWRLQVWNYMALEDFVYYDWGG